MKKHLKLLTLAAILVVAATTAVMAQLPPGGGPQPGGGLGPDPTPIDGGVSLLLASGVAYGVRKLRQRRKGA